MASILNVSNRLFQSSPSQKKISIFFSGNLTRRKGAQWLPAISNKLDSNIRIFYTKGLRPQGSLPASDRLQSIGSVPYNDMPQRYRNMDILLMPTVREGFGLSVAEAMACGLPVVATNCSAISELIVEGKGGFLCPLGDVNGVAEKLNILANSLKIRQEMGEYNRSKVEKEFTLVGMINKYNRLFREILER
jgi:glycosyltransferase involved in cell wall biosynthesis